MDVSSGNHLRASRSTSIGEMISPVTNTLSFQMPKAFFFFDRCGTRSAIGLPFLVITTAWPVRSTSSIKARHLALNSDASIIRGIGMTLRLSPRDHPVGRVHVGGE